MKRLLASALLASAFACTSSVHEASSPSDAGVIELEATAAPAHAAAPPAQDLVADVVPAGAFVDVGSFCTAQEKLIAPRIAEANLRAKEYGGEADSVPSCKELSAVLATASMDPFIEVKSVMVETGGASSIYLLVNGTGGWTAVRTPFLTAYADDPGCGSIERVHAITDIHEDGGALVVTTESGRTYWRADDDYGELTLNHARACRAGAACAAPQVVQAKAVTHLDDEVPTRVRLFNTSYTVDTSGAIIPATMFDEAKL